MTEKLKILVADDEVNIVNVVKAYLEAEEYEVECAYNGAEALEAFYKHAPDFIILDLMMPLVTGEEVCREIRENSDVPIIMLTAKVAERERIAGLDIGADDYVIKPFSPGELMARVRAILRRQGDRKVLSSLYKDPYLHVDDLSKEAMIENSSIGLTSTEYELLSLMCIHPGRVFGREELVERILGYDYEGYDRTIDAHIKNLRKKLKRPYIETVYGMGYRFKGDAWNEKN